MFIFTIYIYIYIYICVCLCLLYISRIINTRLKVKYILIYKMITFLY